MLQDAADSTTAPSPSAPAPSATAPADAAASPPDIATSSAASRRRPLLIAIAFALALALAVGDDARVSSALVQHSFAADVALPSAALTILGRTQYREH